MDWMMLIAMCRGVRQYDAPQKPIQCYQLLTSHMAAAVMMLIGYELFLEFTTGQPFAAFLIVACRGRDSDSHRCRVTCSPFSGRG